MQGSFHKGRSSLQGDPGAHQENIEILAVCNPVGRAMDMLIIFKGKNYQNSWADDKGLPNIFYLLSESSWMTSSGILWCGLKTFVMK